MKAINCSTQFYLRLGMPFTILSISLLAGCATMNKEECLTADWRTIGYEDGAHGYMASKIADHRKACAEHGVTPNLQQYQAGREKGLRQFCREGNGYQLGVSGHAYAGTCPSDMERAFEAAYHQGREIYNLRYRIRANQNLVNRKKHHLKELKEELDHTNALLVGEGKSAAERVELLARSGEISKEMGKIEGEIHDLDVANGALNQQLAQVMAFNIYQ